MRSDQIGLGTMFWLLVAATTAGTVNGCELVMGIEDREVYQALGGHGGSTSSGGGLGGQSGGGGASGGSGGGVTCPTPTSNWPDSSAYCFENEPTCLSGEDGATEAAALDYQIQSADVVLDQVTGLQWQRTAYTNVALSWSEANDYCSDLALDNLSDWRMPLLREVVSLADFGISSPMLASVFSDDADPFWALEDKGNYYWGMHFNLGIISYWLESGVGGLMVRCVHGAASTSTYALGPTNETIVDSTLGLEWMIDVKGDLDWQESLSYCSTLVDHGGCWRAPNAKELLTIYKPADAPGLPNIFGAQPLDSYWSSTPDPTGASQAYAVHYNPDNAVMGAASRQPTTNDYWARCVRNPQ